LKADAKEQATRGALYKLGSAGTQALHSRKALDAEIFLG